MISSVASSEDPYPFDSDNDAVDNIDDADDDGDGVSDVTDNCDLAANSNQLDTDGDGAGNACDLDDDNDDLPDLYEQALGSDPSNPSDAPEYIGSGTVCTDGVDNDTDGQVDAADDGCIDTDGDTLPDVDDNCPLVPNYGWQDQDNDGIGDACDETPLPPNTAPTVDAGGPYSVDEGSAVGVTATGNDPEGGPLTFAWDLDGDGIFGALGQSVTFSTTLVEIDGPIAQLIAVKVTDSGGLAATATTTITVRNVAPTIDTITGPTSIVLVNQEITPSAIFNDPGIHDTHTAVWDWGDGTTSPGAIQVKAGIRSVKGSHSYIATGRYRVKLTVSDRDGGSSQKEFQDIVVSGTPEVQFSSPDFRVDEGIGLATITATLSFTTSASVSVQYTTRNGTAMDGSDYYGTEGVLSFDAGEQSKTFKVDIRNDVRDEPDQTILLTLNSPSNATLGTPATATITITDNDPSPSVSLGASTLTANESIGFAQMTVSLSSSSEYIVTVNYTTSDGTATAGSDYTTTTGTLTFAPGSTQETISVPILEDGQGELNETLSLSLSTPVNAALGTRTATTLTIPANDTLTFSSSSYNVQESVGSTTISVRLNATSAQAVTVSYATSDGTATAGSDYTATSGTLTFAPGETAKTFEIPISEDALGEANETVILMLNNPTNATLGTSSTATLTINTNDTLTFSASSYGVHENAGAATIGVRLNAPSGQTVTVNYATSDGTATAGSDYSTTSGTLTFAPGETSKTFSVPVTDDVLGEADETVTLTLSNPTNAVLGTSTTSRLTVDANDTLTFRYSSYSANESAGSATITVRLNAPASQPVTVDYATSDGSATAGSDYTATGGTLTFAPGETTKTFSVAIINDTLDEPNESATLTLSNPSNAVLGTPTSVLLTMVDND